ncbi:MAG: membrane protein insertion efficiency factor YidD [Oscillospiraceae bacterium]|nr:membrane protein insertion efficiency factor YidD [Oscillospiraceae bacterium]
MIKALLLALLRFYKKNISPSLGNHCRFTPTCSEYAMEAIEVHGALTGCALAAWRVLRCNPLCRGGFDPVPEKPRATLRYRADKNKRSN